jgi:ribose-phosphate pyrophosphokinase
MIKIKNTCTILELDKFPDGTLHITNMPIIPKVDDTVVIEWNYENDAELFALICARRHYGDMDAVLYLPYVPHARMDRVKAETDVFTLKYFCDVINSLHFDLVFIKDVHSNVAPALLERVVNLKVTSTIERVKDMCDMRLSFSKLTFPHRMMRVILLEAVYRAKTIERGEKYHK